MAQCNVVELHFPHGHSAVTSATRPAVRYHRVATNTGTQIAAKRSHTTGRVTTGHAEVRRSKLPIGVTVFSRNKYFLSQSINFLQFMLPEGSLPRSQELATCPYPVPDQSSNHLPTWKLQDKL